ncbi:hypothetical protein PI124_g23006 [Phytophthora idaei]|nr:hypothetical protein PI125_g25400 [Phytophthora idaei]KAG3125050.1 hypothetical protein PI126_g22948 [Phytophthora idaei]KAG3231900.1 hypothetical protein PI124_g23006 [Phytophthora idaei]
MKGYRVVVATQHVRNVETLSDVQNAQLRRLLLATDDQEEPGATGETRAGVQQREGGSSEQSE